MDETWRYRFLKLSKIAIGFDEFKGMLIQFKDQEELYDTIKAYGLGIKNLTKEVQEMQKYLFGMYQKGTIFPICHGYNEWKNCDNPNDFFGKGRGIDPLPPYDITGIYNLRETLRKEFGLSIETMDYNIRISGPAVLVGGSKTNPKAGEVIAFYSKYLPFRFMEKEKIPPHLLPKDSYSKKKFSRYYIDKNDKRYRKTSKTGKYVVDYEKYKEKELFGPIVSSEGHITKDILLVTILPGENGPITIVTDAYGSAARITDILCSADILRNLVEALAEDHTPRFIGESHSWLQAVFEVPVEVKDNMEYYLEPNLLEVRPLTF